MDNALPTPDLSAFEDNTDLDGVKDLTIWIALEEAALSAAKKEIEARKEQLDATKEKVAQIFKAKGIKTHKLDNGLSPCRATSTKYYVKGEVDQEQLCQWFEDNNLAENVKRSVNFQTMQSVLNARKEAGEEIPTHLVDFSERDSLRMNGKSAFLNKNQVKFSLPEIKVKQGNILVKDK